MMSDWHSGVEYIAEPDKFIEMQWHDFDNLPEPLFLPWKHLRESQFLETLKSELKKTETNNNI